MKKNWIYLLLMLAMMLPACKKILNIDRATDPTPTPVTVEDFEQMLNSPEICETPFYLIDEVTDDTYRDLGNTSGNFYTWAMDPWSRSEDPMFKNCYKWIVQMNLVINGMPKALPAGQMSDRRALAIAQAKINRAYFYLQLVNIYGKHYQVSTAGIDLGVPLILQVNNQVSYPRASVAQVYQQILTDLREALATAELPDTDKKNIIYPGKAAALALLARTYLYMGNYPQAEKAAADALAIKDKLLNYLGYKAPGSNDGRLITLVDQKKNDEVLLLRVNTVIGISNASFDYQNLLYPSAELLASFDQTNDKRYIASFKPQSFYSFGIINNDCSYNYSIGVPEIMLIKAECLARANDAVGAVNLLNTLRAKRIVNYMSLPTNITAEQALSLVLEERRRELMFKGLRLFDLKRLNLDPRFRKDIVRRDQNGKALVTLPAGSPNYLIPFTKATLNANPSLVQNPRVQL